MVPKSQDPIPKNLESLRRDVSVLALSDSGLWLFGDSQRNFVPRISEFRTEIFNFNNDTRIGLPNLPDWPGVSRNLNQSPGN